MKKVYFKNAGSIDPVSICTMGVNAKDSDNPIGFFGTGLKYAISVILRDGGKISVYDGLDEYRFSTDKKEIRGKEFDIVTMNGNNIGFTTELGKNWKLWQAFRELYCNAADEGGDVTDKTRKPKSGTVLIVAEHDLLHECYLNMAEFVLDAKPILAGGRCDIHQGATNNFFYKGIKIYSADRPALFTYNITKDLQITEDRTAAHYFQLKERAADAIASSKDEDIIFKAIHAREGSFEESLDYSYDLTCVPSNMFLDIVEQEYKRPTANRSLAKVLSKYRKLPEMEPVELSKVNKMMLDKAVSFCKRIGYEVSIYPIIATDSLAGGIMGQAKNNKIYLGMDAFGMGTKYVASTLIEEYLHIKTGYGDTTRELQNYLFNEIVNFGEQLIGEPV